jgi:hypothetical protein
LSVPSTVVCPREGSLLLASLGRVRKVQETAFAVGRRGDKSVALKRILEAAPVPSSTPLLLFFMVVVARPSLA